MLKYQLVASLYHTSVQIGGQIDNLYQLISPRRPWEGTRNSGLIGSEARIFKSFDSLGHVNKLIPMAHLMPFASFAACLRIYRSNPSLISEWWVALSFPEPPALLHFPTEEKTQSGRSPMQKSLPLRIRVCPCVQSPKSG